jgi:MFS transporter, ACS family, glucarate transporter
MDSHAAIPWSKLLASPTVLLLWLYYFCISFVWYFYITWLPKYMRDGLHLPADSKSALLAGLPLFLGGIGCFLGGVIVKRMVLAKVADLGRSRRIVGIVGLLGAGAMLYFSTIIGNPVLAVVAMGVSGFFNDLSMPGAWGACMDVGGKAAGTLSGSMNMMGNLGGFLSPIVLNYIMESHAGDWHVPLHVAAATYLVAAACWVFIDPVTPLEQPE